MESIKSVSKEVDNLPLDDANPIDGEETGQRLKIYSLDGNLLGTRTESRLALI